MPGRRPQIGRRRPGILDPEDPRLRHLDEEQRLVARLRRHGHGDDALEERLVEPLRGVLELHFDLRLRRLEEHLRAVRRLDRGVLDVDLLDAEDGLLRIGHGWRSPGAGILCARAV
jgi:hypothetical protein